MIMTAGARRLWRMEDPVLEEVPGEDKPIVRVGGMWEAQREWWELQNRIKILVGGYGAGKSIILCKRAIALAIQNAPAPHALVSPTYPMAEHTIIETLCALLEGKQKILKGFNWWYLKSKPYVFHIYYRGRRAKIIVYSGENPDRLKGPNLGSAGIDEPFMQPRGVFEQMMARIRHPAARVEELGLTGTPEQLNWGYELAEGDLREKYDVGVVRAATMQNKALRQSFAQEMLRGFDDVTADAYVRGLFVNLTAGRVIHRFNKDEHVVTRPWPKGVVPEVGMDFNVSPMAATVFWTKGDEVHIDREIELDNSDTQDMCALLRAEYWDKGLRDIYPDSNAGRSTASPGGKTDYDWIREAGFTIHKKSTNPSRRDRFNATNAMLRPGDQGRVRLTISPRCKKLAQYFGAYSYPEMHKPAQKAMSHLIDAATYPIVYKFPVPPRGRAESTKLKGH